MEIQPIVVASSFKGLLWGFNVRLTWETYTVALEIKALVRRSSSIQQTAFPIPQHTLVDLPIKMQRAVVAAICVKTWCDS